MGLTLTYNNLKLLGVWSSPFVLKIRWALSIKGIEYEYIEEDLLNKSPLLLNYNPVHKKVPVLVHDGKAIAESSIILEYIEETWRNNPLMPDDPHDRASARFWCKFGEDKLSPPIWQVFITQGEEQQEAFKSAIENIHTLEKELRGKKKFLSGEKIGLIDISFGWFAYVIPMYEEITGLKMITVDEFPFLAAWMKEFLSSPEIRDSLPPREELLARYRAIREAFLGKGK